MMEINSSVNLPMLKVFDEETQVEYEFIASSAEESAAEMARSEQIKEGLNRVEQAIRSTQDKVDLLNQDIDRLTNHADATDNFVAVGCGLLAGLVDSLWVGEFSFEQGKAWSNHTVNDFVMKSAQGSGYEGKRLDGAIRFLEKEFPVPSDSIWKGKKVSITPSSHHIDDFSHHPTPMGLFYSILTQFTKTGYFQNKNGASCKIGIDEKGLELIGDDLKSKITCGAVNWFFHLVSDMSGSNKTAGVGMGIPGPIMSLLKEVSAIPGLNLTGLPKLINKAFVDNKLDLRGELAYAHQTGRQAVPVMINEALVRSFYFIRRLIAELKAKPSFEDIDWSSTLPRNNRTITRMLTIATGTFTAVDLTDAAIRAGLQSGGDLVAFGGKLMLRVNVIGLGRFAVAVWVDLSQEAKKREARAERISLLTEQLHWANAKVAYMQGDVLQAASRTETSLQEAEQMMRQSIEMANQAWEANRNSLQNITRMKNMIQTRNPELISNIQDVLTWGQVR